MPFARRTALMITAAALSAATLIAVAPAAQADAAPPSPQTIASGIFNSYVVSPDGTVRAAGDNLSSQIAPAGDPAPPVTTLTTLPALPGSAHAVSVESSLRSTIVIGSNGRAYGAGRNSTGQLTGTPAAYAPFHEMTGLPPNEVATKAAVTQWCAVVLTQSGKLFRAGHNQYGECPLAPGADEDELTPMPGVPAGRTVIDVSIGAFNDEYLVALLDDGTLVGSGDNFYSQLPGPVGDVSSLTLLNSPLNGSEPVDIVSVTAGSRHLLAVGQDGEVYGAGYNVSGQLTAGPIVNGWMRLKGLPDGITAAKAAGGFASTVVLGSDGNIYGAGNIYYFDPAATDGGGVPTLTLLPKPAGVGLITELDGGGETYVIRGAHGFVWGAGDNSSGALTGTTEPVAGLHKLSGQPNIPTAAPTFTGTMRFGSTLTAQPMTWATAPTTTTHQWHRDGIAIPGATASTYTLQRADAGRTITLQVTAVTAGDSDTASSSAGQVVANQLFINSRPAIKGKAKKGKKLSIQSPGAWSAAPTVYSYRWLRNGAPIKGATKKTYKLKKADKRKHITVRITAYRPGFLPGVADSYNYKRPTR